MGRILVEDIAWVISHHRMSERRLRPSCTILYSVSLSCRERVEVCVKLVTSPIPPPTTMPTCQQTHRFATMPASSPTIRQRSQNYEAKQQAQLVSHILRRRLRAVV
jgi:hypothetical protein